MQKINFEDGEPAYYAGYLAGVASTLDPERAHTLNRLAMKLYPPDGAGNAEEPERAGGTD